MPEDKLTPGQRIRLESVNQAVSISMGTPNKTVSKIIEDAKTFETYILTGGNKE